MGSVVITGKRYLAHPEAADRHGPFTKTFLAEGDSWMDASAAAQGSLPEYLTQEFNRRGKSYLIINISTSGQTLRRIESTMQGDYVWWLQQMPFDALLFSAAGNDFIDAARDPNAGQGLLRDMAGQAQPADGYDCVQAHALAQLRRYLNYHFDSMVAALRSSSKNASTPVYLNCYDTPTARDAAAIPGLVGPWLHKAYVKNGIAPALWPSLTQGLFKDILAIVEGWSRSHAGVQAVPTSGRLLAAAVGSSGSNADWKNEIHPNARGWRKLAPVWADALG